MNKHNYGSCCAWSDQFEPDRDERAPKLKWIVPLNITDIPDSVLTDAGKQVKDAQLLSEQDRMDAKRYRWLRSPSSGPRQLGGLHHWVNDDCNPPSWELKCGSDLDAAIDAAIQQSKETA